MEAQEVIEESKKILLETYSPQPVVLDHGKGAYVYDTDGKKYVDFAVGIAVASLGHAHPEMLKTIKKQSGRLMACQASYATIEKLETAELLTDNSCFDMVYFSNSGTESVEAALKCARKWAYDNKGKNCNEIIAFRNSFHGRTYGSGSVTEKRHTQEFFGPYLPNVHFAQFNDISSVSSLINENTAAIIVEPVQGEGGLVPANPFFLGDLRRLCDKHKICLIFDEVQAGMGRMGTLFAYQSFKCCPDCIGGGDVNPNNLQPIEPDIACLAKGMGGGFPVGAMVAKREFGKAIVVGTHGTTYGGNPLACAVAGTVIKEMLKDGFMDHVNKLSKHLFDGLEKIRANSNKITDIRGKGLMIGVDTAFPIKDVIDNLQKNGLMTTQAGKATLRITPPLIATLKEADEALEIIDKTLKEMS
ncbi:MAG: aminotransferase class III-fold pyridoxal phosphate-dependent enzyme [Alphaproteobacteria bacterium]|nr:aminotransferase class III-fold pyridoxal phosphate-dependent enzyme [Alphaproteobacteria bacterium]